MPAAPLKLFSTVSWCNTRLLTDRIAGVPKEEGCLFSKFRPLLADISELATDNESELAADNESELPAADCTSELASGSVRNRADSLFEVPVAAWNEVADSATAAAAACREAAAQLRCEFQSRQHLQLQVRRQQLEAQQQQIKQQQQQTQAQIAVAMSDGQIGEVDQLQSQLECLKEQQVKQQGQMEALDLEEPVLGSEAWLRGRQLRSSRRASADSAMEEATEAGDTLKEADAGAVASVEASGDGDAEAAEESKGIRKQTAEQQQQADALQEANGVVGQSVQESEKMTYAEREAVATLQGEQAAREKSHGVAPSATELEMHSRKLHLDEEAVQLSPPRMPRRKGTDGDATKISEDATKMEEGTARQDAPSAPSPTRNANTQIDSTSPTVQRHSKSSCLGESPPFRRHSVSPSRSPEQLTVHQEFAVFGNHLRSVAAKPQDRELIARDIALINRQSASAVEQILNELDEMGSAEQQLERLRIFARQTAPDTGAFFAPLSVASWQERDVGDTAANGHARGATAASNSRSQSSASQAEELVSPVSPTIRRYISGAKAAGSSRSHSIYRSPRSQSTGSDCREGDTANDHRRLPSREVWPYAALVVASTVLVLAFLTGWCIDSQLLAATRRWLATVVPGGTVPVSVRHRLFPSTEFASKMDSEITRSCISRCSEVCRPFQAPFELMHISPRGDFDSAMDQLLASFHGQQHVTGKSSLRLHSVSQLDCSTSRVLCKTLDCSYGPCKISKRIYPSIHNGGGDTKDFADDAPIEVS